MCRQALRSYHPRSRYTLDHVCLPPYFSLVRVGVIVKKILQHVDGSVSGCLIKTWVWALLIQCFSAVESSQFCVLAFGVALDIPVKVDSRSLVVIQVVVAHAKHEERFFSTVVSLHYDDEFFQKLISFGVFSYLQNLYIELIEFQQVLLL